MLTFKNIVRLFILFIFLRMEADPVQMEIAWTMKDEGVSSSKKLHLLASGSASIVPIARLKYAVLENENST